MKRLILVFLAALAIVSCQKKENQPTPPATQDVTFSVTEITPDLKSTDVIECVDNIPTHAWIVINGVDYYPELFDIGGQLYTQALKLAATDGVLDGVDDYCISVFFLYDEVNNIPGYQEPIDPFNPLPTDDVIVFATPEKDGDDTQGYDTYVQWPLEECFEVSAFAKAEIPMEVLCFQPADYEYFGFDWFIITEIVIRQACFFGDICIDDPTFYANDQYYSIGGVQVDEEAVIQVIVKEGGNEVPYSPFRNAYNEDINDDIYGEGKVLCVDYPDNLSLVGETFTFEVQVWQPDANGSFYWQTYATYTTTDDIPLAETDNDQDLNTDNDDGVVDFAVGMCSPDSYPIYAWIAPPVVFVNAETDDGNMDDNQGNGWPYISWVINGDNIDFTFHNPTAISASFYFDYRIDDEAGSAIGGVTGELITKGPYAGTNFPEYYNFVVVGPLSSPTVNLTGTSKIQVRLRLGPERDYDFDWITFVAN